MMRYPPSPRVPRQRTHPTITNLRAPVPVGVPMSAPTRPPIPINPTAGIATNPPPPPRLHLLLPRPPLRVRSPRDPETGRGVRGTAREATTTTVSPVTTPTACMEVKTIQPRLSRASRTHFLFSYVPLYYHPYLPPSNLSCIPCHPNE